MSLYLLLLTLGAVLGQQYCLTNVACQTNVNCTFGVFSGQCCQGRCQPSTRLQRGFSCDTSVCGSCDTGLTCTNTVLGLTCQSSNKDFTNNCPCAGSGDCLSGFCDPITLTCLNGNLPIGSVCSQNGQCASGSCTSGICAGMVIGSPCSGNGQCSTGLFCDKQRIVNNTVLCQPLRPSYETCADSTECLGYPNAYCLLDFDGNASNLTCYPTLRHTDEACQTNANCLNSPIDQCQKPGMSSIKRCVTQTFAEIGQNCGSMNCDPVVTPALICNSTNRCIAIGSVPYGGTCDTNSVCAAGLVCSYNSRLPKQPGICVQQQSYVAGQNCSSSLQCPLYSLCAGGAPQVSAVCSSTYLDVACNPSSGGQCGNVAGLACLCNGGISGTCQISSTPSFNFDCSGINSEVAALNLPIGFDVTTLSSSQQRLVLSQQCCRNCKNSATLYAYKHGQYTIDCGSLTLSMMPAICSSPDTTAKDTQQYQNCASYSAPASSTAVVVKASTTFATLVAVIALALIR